MKHFCWRGNKIGLDRFVSTPFHAVAHIEPIFTHPRNAAEASHLLYRDGLGRLLSWPASCTLTQHHVPPWKACFAATSCIPCTPLWSDVDPLLLRHRLP